MRKKKKIALLEAHVGELYNRLDELALCLDEALARMEKLGLLAKEPMLTVRHLVLTNKAGESRVILTGGEEGSTSRGGALYIYDEFGNPALSARTLDDGSSLQLFNADDSAGVSLRTTPTDGLVVAGGHRGHTAVLSGPSLAMFGLDRTVKVSEDGLEEVKDPDTPAEPTPRAGEWEEGFLAGYDLASDEAKAVAEADDPWMDGFWVGVGLADQEKVEKVAAIELALAQATSAAGNIKSPKAKALQAELREIGRSAQSLRHSLNPS